MSTQTYPRPILTLDQELTASRCDRCNAEGRVLVTKGSGRMVFCAHHYRRHEDALAVDGWKVVADSRAELN